MSDVGKGEKDGCGMNVSSSLLLFSSLLRRSSALSSLLTGANENTDIAIVASFTNTGAVIKVHRTSGDPKKHGRALTAQETNLTEAANWAPW